MWRYAAALIVIGLVAAWLLTTSQRVLQAELTPQTPDLANGARIFLIGGCASCHAVPKSTGAARRVLAGGLELKTAFGTFIAPNISPDRVRGIGDWSEADFVTAMRHGTAPDGRHYYPAFPYASYARMRNGDIRDLFAYLKTLPVSPQANRDHDIGFPFSIRRLIGFWKLLYLSDKPVQDLTSAAPEVQRGQYLAEGAGHCGECHTPRGMLGGPDLSAWLKGGPNPDGEGRIPDITPAKLTWSAAEIAEYFKTGFTPDYDSVGGSMVEVVTNLSGLEDADRADIAAYLKALPGAAP